MLNKLILLLVIIVNYFLLHIQELVFLSGVCIRVCCHSWHVELCRVVGANLVYEYHKYTIYEKGVTIFLPLLISYQNPFTAGPSS